MGLDLLRSVAITSVVLYHAVLSGAFAAPILTGVFAAPIRHYGQIGVDLFFVLSGFLIGGQVFGEVLKSGNVALGKFYARRFLRTLPSYYLILLLYVLIPQLTVHSSPPTLWKYVLFLQNLSRMETFPASWSLCVEEHFYLLFPLLVLLFIRLKTPRGVVVTVIALLVFGILLRTVIWYLARPDVYYYTNPPKGWDMYSRSIYFPTYCRLDGLTLGVVLAALRRFRPVLWARFLSCGNKLLYAGLAALLIAAASAIRQFSLVSCALTFPLFAVAFSLLLAASVSPKCFLAKLRVPGVRTVALLSYAIYLTHALALYLSELTLTRLNVPLLTVPISICFVVAVASVIYFLVERPFLMLRDKWFGVAAPKSVRLASATAFL